MAIIYTSRNLPGSYSGYTNGSWGSLMNSYAVRFTPGLGGQGGGAFEGTTFYFSASVYFPNSGNYTVRASADNSGSLNVAGQGCSVSGFGSDSSTTFYRNRGTYTVSGSVYNAFNGPSYASNPYGIAFTIDAPPPPPAPTVSISASPSTIIRGNCVTLTYSSSGVNLSSASLTDVSNPGFSGSATVCPNSTRTYTYQVCGEGGCTSRTATVTVYIPPVITVSLNVSSIIAGQCATLTWGTTGDADRIYWTSGNISNGNLTSNQSVCPADTTTYCAYVSGLGGTSPTSCATLTVYQIPVIQSFTVPESLNYGEQGFVEYEVDYANIKVEIQVVYLYNTVNVDKGTTQYGTSGTAELSGSNRTVTNNIATNIEYDNFGPRSVQYTLNIQGSGGSASQTKTIPIIIDETVDNVNIEETDGLFKDQEPVYTPVVVPEEVVTSDLYYIDGIDIPVEIKSDFPIFASINQSPTWLQLRQIGSAPPAGSSLPQDPQEIVLEAKSRNLPVDDFPLIARPQLNVAYENLVTCISIIDESSPAISTHQSDWSAFRNNYPYRTFYLLQPAINANGSIRYPISRMNMPNNYINDPYANGTIQVRRDDGNVNLRSDWFALCNLDVVPEGSYVSVWLDISGSMVYATVAASYQYFEQRCAAAGIIIILETSDSGERWIPGHNKDLPPSGQLYIIDPDTGNEVTTIRIANGECITLTWFVFGEIDTASLTGIGQLYANPVGGQYGYVGQIEVCPEVDTTYQLIANGPAGDTFRTVFVDVLTRPTIVFSANPGTSIVAGSCVTISWETTGDADRIVWTSGNITNGNLTSSENVCPQDTTTYCAYADGEAGQSPTACITIIVAQPPTASITAPAVINYGDNLFIEYETEYANVSITITPIYIYLDGSTVTGDPVSITPVAESAEIGGGSGSLQTVVSDTNFQVPITWNNFGPSSIQLNLSAEGTGGTKTALTTVTVNIDQTPENITIDETGDKFKDQDPVYAPDIVPQDVVESQLYLINDIDIPVEIKSDYPIKVDINKSNNWQDLREI